MACFVKRDLKTVRYVIESDDGVLHIAGERQLRLQFRAGSSRSSRRSPAKVKGRTTVAIANLP